MWKRPAGLLALLIVGTSLASAATVVTWTVINAAFNDGGTLSGSFGYDATSDTYSSIALTTTGGTIRSGAQYDTFNNCCGPEGPAFLLFITNAPGDLTGTPVLSIDLLAPMTIVGGTIGFDLAGAYFSENSCANAGCNNAANPIRDLVSGSITTGSPVPEPGTFLLTAPFGALAFLLRRRNRVRAR
jgi:hypothetical protein